MATEEDDTPTIQPLFGRPEILIVGRLSKRESYKGHHELLEAWHAISATVPNARLRIVGQGDGESELKRIAEGISGGDSIIFEGFVTEARLRELYATSAVFAMPSRGEGFGLVYIEAMRHGLPVITCANEAGAEVIEDGVTGFAVDLAQSGELAARLITLLQTPALARRMGEAGQQRWADRYRYSNFRERFLGILDRFLT